MRLNEFHDVEELEIIGDQAKSMHKDHEVQMARSELYKAAKSAMALHDMLKHLPEDANIEGWVQAKITKAADYLSSVKSYLEYEQHSTGEITVDEMTPAPVIGESKDQPVTEGAKPDFLKGAKDLTPVLKKEAKKRGEELYRDKDGVLQVRKLKKKQGVAEAGIAKKIKRAAQGWGMFDKDTPGDIISKTRGQDTDTLKFLQRKPGQKSGAHSPQDLQAKAIDRELKHRGVAEGEYDHSELYNGCYVRDEQDGANGEVFRMSGDPEDRRVRIEDKDGRGWYISPHRLQPVDENDPAVARWFGNSRDEEDLAEGGKQLDELSRKTLKSYFPQRVDAAKKIIDTNRPKALRITKVDLPRAMKKLKDPNYGKAEPKIQETAGATGSGAIATSMGGGNGFKNGGPGTIKRESVISKKGKK